jgi:acetyl-CoA C-acetyltransferase
MSKKVESYIVYTGRTPIGKLGGALSSMPAPRLGAVVVKDALQKTALDPDAVDEIIMGNVLTAGVGQAPARQAAIYGGLSQKVTATTVNKVCGSGLKAVMLADQAVRLGDADIVFAGGQECMSLAPHLLLGSRTGYKFGAFEAKDSMQWDGLWDPYSNVAMGECGEYCAKHYGFTREQQDAFARESYFRARQAIESGLFKDEIVPVEIKSRKETLSVTQDEEPFSVNIEKLSTLRPAFQENGTITAGNASSINDGAALVVVASEKALQTSHLKPVAKIIATATHAHDPNFFTTAPVDCIKKLFQKTGFTKNDIDLFEINEAFAVVTMAALHDLELDPAQVNINGGAVALGHPIGASGTRILVTLINSLIKNRKKRGLATLCIGGGEAVGVIVELV